MYFFFFGITLFSFCNASPESVVELIYWMFDDLSYWFLLILFINFGKDLFIRSEDFALFAGDFGRKMLSRIEIEEFKFLNLRSSKQSHSNPKTVLISKRKIGVGRCRSTFPERNFSIGNNNLETTWIWSTSLHLSENNDVPL